MRSDGVELLKKWKFKGIPVAEYKKSQHCSKNYFKTINSVKETEIHKVSLEEALEYILTSKELPENEQRNIKRFTIYHNDKIICLHCSWAPTIFGFRNLIYKKTGWYPYVTGLFLEESTISKNNDNWIGDRNFNALEFDEFEVEEIKLKNISTGSGTALMLFFNNFKILLDCCIDLQNPKEWNQEFYPDLIFTSHAHKDHFASLEILLSNVDTIPIIMSYTTLDLISYFMQNNSTIQKYLKEYSYPLIFGDIYFINSNLNFQILKAGHYPGGAMLYIFTPNHRILYSGDSFLYDLQPLKGGGSGIQNLNGPLHTLILDGQFCNTNFPSQKWYLDMACESALKTLLSGAPVLVIGDAGSWLLIFYLKFVNGKFYLKSNT